ncbi:hypothetical protein OIU76_005169 [Salix suchowensis]|nr:hypothetical protein OIU76_005169 [Salix suchowensis]
MSFLAGRLAGKEGAFFFQESKHAVNRLAEKSTTTVKNLPPSSSSTIEHESQADVLPEVLRHSLPGKIFGKPSEPSSLSTSSKWALRSDHPISNSTVSPDVLNPLRAYVSLPQVTFGPKRWELPSEEHSVLASTANEMRKDRYTTMNPEKLKTAAEGLTYSYFFFFFDFLLIHEPKLKNASLSLFIRANIGLNYCVYSWKGICGCNCDCVWWRHSGIFFGSFQARPSQ